MSDNNWDLDEDDAQDASGLVKQLRKQIKTLERDLVQYRTERRDSAAEKVLAKLPEGKRAKAKELIGESDPDEWFEKYGDLFGGSTDTTDTTTADTTSTDKTDAVTQSVVSDDQARALQDIAAATQNGSPALTDIHARAQAAIAAAGSPAELTRVMEAIQRGRV